MWSLIFALALASGIAFGQSSSSSQLAGKLPGVVDGSSAAAGYVDEYIQGSRLYTARLSVSSGGAYNLTSIALTAGDWDVSACASVIGTNASTLLTSMVLAVSATSATLPGDSAYANPSGGELRLREDYGSGLALGTASHGFCLSSVKVSLSSSATRYLYIASAFTNTAEAYGSIWARRVR